jgi:hypothetical protein
MKFTHGSKSKIGAGAPSVKALEWFISRLGPEAPEGVEVRHSGKCGRCNRTITTPASVDSGIGPECAETMGVSYGTSDLFRKFDVKGYVLAGNSTFTVTSKRTGTRFTYRVRQADESRDGARPWFVSVLNGPDNEKNYAYIGVIWP